MSLATYDVVVIGAGIVGAACADECVRQGLRVAVVDRDVTDGATPAAMGHVVVMDDSEAQFVLTRYSQQLWHKLRPDLPADVEYDPRGTIWIAADDDEMQEVRRKESYYSRRGLPVSVLDPKTLEETEPNLRKGLVGGLFVPEDVVVIPSYAARFFLDRARVGGATIYPGVQALQIGKGIVRLDDGSELSAAVIVNAAGAWSPALTPGLDIKKRKGHLTITNPQPGFVHHQLVELGYLKSAHSHAVDSVAFNIQPRKSGQLLIGSSRQYDVEHKEIDNDILDRMMRRAQEYMPGLAGISTVRTWTGFRAATPHKLPLIGPWPADPTVYLATGHEGLGITTSLATARLLVDQVVGRESEIPVGPYLPCAVPAIAGGFS